MLEEEARERAPPHAVACRAMTRAGEERTPAACPPTACGAPPLRALPVEHPAGDHRIGSDGDHLIVMHDHEKEHQRRKGEQPRDQGRLEHPRAICLHTERACVSERGPALPAGIDGKRHRALVVALKGEQAHQGERRWRRRSAGRRHRPRDGKRPRAADTFTGKIHIPPNLVVKSQAIDIVGLLLSLTKRKTSSTHRVEQGNRALSCSHYLRVIGLPLNSMESENFQALPPLEVTRAMMFM